jgi:FlaG/FlaF family flagellin (archaellin)
MLSEITNVINNTITINLDKSREINSIGIGNAILDNASDPSFNITFYNGVVQVNSFSFTYIDNGLYIMPGTALANRIVIDTNAKTIGRVGAGLCVDIPTAIAKEPAFCSTSEPRITLSGQVVAGRGGYNYKTVSLDSRYKINSFAINEIKNGYKYIGMGYPFFIDLSVENYKLPFSKFYGIDTNQQNISFESGIKKYLYSRRFEFKECF